MSVENSRLHHNYNLVVEKITVKFKNKQPATIESAHLTQEEIREMVVYWDKPY